MADAALRPPPPLSLDLGSAQSTLDRIEALHRSTAPTLAAKVAGRLPKVAPPGRARDNSLGAALCAAPARRMASSGSIGSFG
eukprot:196535-Pleurochrysis_carterae.AAC.2